MYPFRGIYLICVTPLRGAPRPGVTGATDTDRSDFAEPQVRPAQGLVPDPPERVELHRLLRRTERREHLAQRHVRLHR